MAPIRTLLAALLALLCAPLWADTLAVTIEGLDGELERNARAYMDIVQEQQADDLLPSRVRRLHGRAPRQIRQALQPFGYYRVSVDAALERTGALWSARYRVEKGEPVRLAAVDVQLTGPGREDPALQEQVRSFPLGAGDALAHAPYEQAKQDLQRRAEDRGYLQARFTRHQIRIDTLGYEASLVLHLDTGARYRFGEITFAQSSFNEPFLRRYLPFAPGDYYSARSLLDLYQVLSDSDYFARVEVLPQREQAQGGRVPVRVELEPRKRDRYRAGLGMGTDTGPRASLEWERRRVNRRGHQAGAQLKVSPRLSALSARYAVPLRRPASEQMAFTGGFTREDTESRLSRTLTLGVSRTRAKGSWRRTLGLSYEREQFELGDEREQSELLIPAVSWVRTRADDALYPLRGSRLGLDLRGAAGGVLSDASFVRARAYGKLIRSPAPGLRLIVRAELGGTLVGKVQDLPASQRFFAGGDHSVRGYDLEALGPRNDQGEVVGGRYLFTASAEVERRIHGKWSAALFYDLGNAFNSPGAGVKRGAGLGLRWRSPVGLVRLDVAAALSEPGTPWRIHLIMGPDL